MGWRLPASTMDPSPAPAIATTTATATATATARETAMAHTVGCVATADGHINIAVAGQAIYERFCDDLTAAGVSHVGRGVFGIPTFFVGDEMYFGKNTLGDVEEGLIG